MSSNHPHGGRVHPGPRNQNTQDTATPPDLNRANTVQRISIRPEHAEGIAITVDHAEKQKTRNDHRNRLKRMVAWCEQEYDDEKHLFIRDVTQEELNDKSKHFHKQRRDFIYAVLDPGVIMAFLSTVRKENGTGKTRSHSHIRKFHDAVLFGAREQGVTMSDDYYRDIETYLKSFRKESVQAKRSGETEELDADPMPFPLYEQLCRWKLDAGNIFGWIYLTLLWNCLGRSASVDPLGLHNLKLGTDSIIVTYDDSKMDNTGERVHPKNCYANPYNPTISTFLALEVYIVCCTLNSLIVLIVCF